MSQEKLNNTGGLDGMNGGLPVDNDLTGKLPEEVGSTGNVSGGGQSSSSSDVPGVVGPGNIVGPDGGFRPVYNITPGPSNDYTPYEEKNKGEYNAVSSYLLPNGTYTLVAIPEPGFFFEKWGRSGGVSDGYYNTLTVNLDSGLNNCSCAFKECSYVIQSVDEFISFQDREHPNAGVPNQGVTVSIFKINSGSAPQKIEKFPHQVNYNEQYTIQLDFSKSKFIFDGWYGELSPKEVVDNPLKEFNINQSNPEIDPHTPKTQEINPIVYVKPRPAKTDNLKVSIIESKGGQVRVSSKK